MGTVFRVMYWDESKTQSRAGICPTTTVLHRHVVILKTNEYNCCDGRRDCTVWFREIIYRCMKGNRTSCTNQASQNGID